MALPQSVKKAAEDADQQAKEIAESFKQAQENPDEAINGLLSETEHQGDEPSGPTDGPETPPDPDPEPPPDPQDDWKAKYDEVAQDRDYWQGRFKSVEGKINVEMPALAKQVRELKERNQELEQKLKSVDNRPKLTDEELEKLKVKLRRDMDEDSVESLTEMVSRMSPQVDTSGYETRIEELQNQVNELGKQSREQALEALVPGWRDIQAKPDCQKFLQKVEPFTGQMFNAILLDHWNNGNVAGCAQIFNKFLEEQQQRQQQNGSAPSASVEPDDRPGSPAPSAGGKKVWTMAEIDKIDRLEKQGHFKRRKEDLAKLRHDIEIAASEGRVRA